MSKIVAIDPGIANCGAAQWDEKHYSELTLHTTKEIPLKTRIGTIVRDLKLIFPRPKVVLVENCFGNYNRNTTFLIGAILGVFWRSSVVELVAPALWPKELFGKKHVSNYKKKAMELATKILGHAPDSQHSADAICMIEWYRKKYG